MAKKSRPLRLNLTALVLSLGVAVVAATHSPAMTVFAQQQASVLSSQVDLSNSIVNPTDAPMAQAAEPTPAPTLPVPTPTASPTPNPVATVNEIALTAMPTRIGDDNSLKIKPGEKRQVTLKVYNNSAVPITIKSEATDFIVGADGKTPVPVEVAEADNRWSMREWIMITPATQTIKPQQTSALNVLIEVPEDALAGGHFAMITHQVIGTGDNKQGGTDKSSAINQKVGTLLYVIVPGNITEEAFIRNFYIPQFQELGPVPYSFTVDNDSDIHIQPNLTFNVYNIWGKKIYSTPVDTLNIFPKSSREFAGNWNRIWGFGQYKAEVIAVYGTTASTKVQTVVFWLFPLNIVISIIILILTIVAVTILIRRHVVTKQQAEKRRIKELEATVARLEQDKK